MAQLEMFLKPCRSSVRYAFTLPDRPSVAAAGPLRPDALARVEEGAGGFTTCSVPLRPSAMADAAVGHRADPDRARTTLSFGADDIDIAALIVVEHGRFRQQGRHIEPALICAEAKPPGRSSRL